MPRRDLHKNRMMKEHKTSWTSIATICVSGFMFSLIRHMWTDYKFLTFLPDPAVTRQENRVARLLPVMKFVRH